MKLLIENPGLFTTVQDLGRRGYQMQGVPVAGAMDGAALRLGNALLGNEKDPRGLEPAGLEITVLGPSIKVMEGSGCFVVTGAEAGVTKNGVSLPCWTVHRLDPGDAVAFSAPKVGCRSYFCVSGGIDVPLVMGSRSTYTRGKFGGHRGRALKAGDVLVTGAPNATGENAIGAYALWAKCAGLSCPLRPDRDPHEPLRAIPGPQDDLFTEEGLAAFYSSEYVIANSADRMGFRLEGPVIAHKGGADIVSDAICLGSVQVPGHGQPIVMLADRQTTGGYTKIATVCAVDAENLAQRLPGQKVRFEKITVEAALNLLHREEALIGEAKRLREAWLAGSAFPFRRKGAFDVRVAGELRRVEWERME
ncbi:MAG: biotin-dependent carboxyltransferase family protein [Synergistaceae bacterium]|jgi:biotin-dependent carboxylase-like uncharacterized protein|nr:biotin-dependent carboxyltransferase family protein [Synergistaceae bacterium]